MIDGLKPYAEMKESGASWLGSVPKHWQVLPHRALFKEISDRDHPEADMLSVTIGKGVIRQKSLLEDSSKKDSSKVDKSAYKLVQPGDIAYNKMRAWQGAVGVSDFRGIVSPAYVVQRPNPHASPRYLHYLLRTPAFAKEAERWSYGITSDMWSLRPEHFRQIYSCVPPPDEQIAIVRFLDHADRRIRRAIGAKQKLIRLLEEQKRTIIHHAVTRGLDPDVRHKLSGVEWLGDVPEHWAVYRIKQVTQILRGKFAHRPRNDPSLYDGQYPFIQTGEVARSGKAITTYRQTLNERGLEVSKMFPKGTLVMTIAANIGEVAILDFEACFPDSVVGFVPSDSVERDYLYYLFTAMKQELLREAPVNTQGNLNVDRIGCRGIALPLAEEQRLIVLSIEKRTEEMDAAIARSSREISLLKEFRVRLTADVVTGKLDVRTAAVELPVMVEPADNEFDAEEENENDSMEDMAAEDQAA